MSSGAPVTPVVVDPRLLALMLRDPLRCATVSEYSAASGVDVDTLLSNLEAPLAAGEFSIEVFGGEVFVRPTTKSIPGNLWGTLRDKHSVERSFDLWRVVREFERAGWRCVLDRERISASIGNILPPPVIALEIRSTLAPLLVPMSQSDVGLVTEVIELAKSGCSAVFIKCEAGSIGAKSQMLRVAIVPSGLKPPAIMLLEAPGYLPGNVIKLGDLSRE